MSAPTTESGAERVPAGDVAKLVEELRAACIGHPHATIAWPHRILHRAADALEASTREVAAKDASISHWISEARRLLDSGRSAVDQLEAAERQRDEAMAALRAYHDAYSDRRFAPEGSWEAGDASAHLEDAHDMAARVLATPTAFDPAREGR